MTELLEILDELKKIRPSITEPGAATIVDKRIALIEKEQADYDQYMDDLAEKWDQQLEMEGF